MTVFMYLYFVGIASCGIQGAEKATQFSGRASSIMCSSGLNSFGGGLIRDVFLLSVFPAVFTLECTPDIAVAMVAALVYLHAQQSILTQKIVKWFAFVADAVGLGTFIAIGVDKAIDLGAGTLTTILSGILTSQGGGILAAVFCGVSLQQVLSTNVAYRLMAVGGVLLYGWWTGSVPDRVFAQYSVILYTTIGALVCNRTVTTEISKHLFQVIANRSLYHIAKGMHHAYPFAPYYRHIIWYREKEKKTIKPKVIMWHKRIHLYHRMCPMRA